MKKQRFDKTERTNLKRLAELIELKRQEVTRPVTVNTTPANKEVMCSER